MSARTTLLTSFLPITYMQPKHYHAIAHSFAQRQRAKHLSIISLRTLSIATGVAPRPSSGSTGPAHRFAKSFRIRFYTKWAANPFRIRFYEKHRGGRGSGTFSRSEKPRDVFPHHVLPVRPVVAAFGAPVIERMANAFPAKNLGQAVRRPGVFPLPGAGGDMNVAGGKLLVYPGIAQVGEVVDGIVEIKIVVIHPVHEIFQVVHAGHSEAALDDVGMLEERVSRVIRAERHAHGRNANLRLATAPDERHDFFAQVRIEDGLHVAAMKRMRGFVVERKSVDGIDAEEFQFAGVDEIGQRADHPLAFQLELVTRARRKAQQRRSPVAVDDYTQFDAQARRMPAMNFALHDSAASVARALAGAPTIAISATKHRPACRTQAKARATSCGVRQYASSVAIGARYSWHSHFWLCSGERNCSTKHKSPSDQVLCTIGALSRHLGGKTSWLRPQQQLGPRRNEFSTRSMPTNRQQHCARQSNSTCSPPSGPPQTPRRQSRQRLERRKK